MNAVKIIAVVLLGLILFLSLAVFGLALTVKMTVLEAGFVTARVNELPFSSLIQESEILELEDNPQLADSLKDILIQHEPQIKEQMGNAIYDIYDYLYGKRENPELATILRDTILSPELTISMVGDLDMAFLAREFLREEILVEEWPADFDIEPYLDEVALELEPWIKEQMAIIIPPFYDYVLGLSQDFNVAISLEPAAEIVGNTLKEAFLESPPPELSGLSRAQLEQAFDTYFESFAGQIPATFTLDESQLDLGETRAEVTRALAEAETALGEARRQIGHFNLAFGLLIGFMLLLVAGIILVYRQVKASARILGIVFLVYGLLGLIGIFIARSLIRARMVMLDMPSSAQQWLTGLVSSSLTPWLILVIILLVIGAALVALSFVYPRLRQQE